MGIYPHPFPCEYPDVLCTCWQDPHRWRPDQPCRIDPRCTREFPHTGLHQPQLSYQDDRIDVYGIANPEVD